MITLRFYTVSIVSFFLALALGVVIGSALDESIVARLESRVDTVSHNLDRVERTNDALKRQVHHNEELVSVLGRFAVEDRLAGYRLMVVAEDGVDPNIVEEVAGLLRDGGADAPAILWATQEWELSDLSARSRLAAALDMSIAQAPTMRSQAWAMLVSDAREPLEPVSNATTTTVTTAPDATTTSPTTSSPSESDSTVSTDTSSADATSTTTNGEEGSAGPGDEDTDVLSALVDTGLVRTDAASRAQYVADGEPGERIAIVHLTAVESRTSNFDLLGDMLRVEISDRMPTMVVDAYSNNDDGASRGAAVRAIREDSSLRSVVATVDHVDVEEGRFALVLAIELLLDGQPGHFGLAEEARDVLPVRIAQ